MSVYIIQEKYMDPLVYIVSAGSMRDAVRLRLELEDIDRMDNAWEPDKYRISKREYCYSDYSMKCGACHKGICMLENPDKDCPARKQKLKEAGQAAGSYADQPVLAPATMAAVW